MVDHLREDSCPYTQAARDDYERRGIAFEYVNVKKNAAELEKMLVLSKGRRAVPVIVDAGRHGHDRLRRHLRGVDRRPGGAATGCGGPSADFVK